MLRMPPIHHLHMATAIAAFAILAPPARSDDGTQAPPESCDVSRLLDRASTWIDGAQQRAIALRRSAREALEDRVARAQRAKGLFVAQGIDASGRATWLHLGEETATVELPKRVVLLIHGLDEDGEVWRDLAPTLAERGHAIVRFDYPCNQAIARSSDLLAHELRLLRSRGVERIDIVAHSMGGLIARDTLTRPGVYAGEGRGNDELPAVDRVLMLGTPHAGSAWARLEPLGQAINLADRAIASRRASALLGFVSEGDGEAARDLMPGSAFLADLNARGVPRGVRFVSIVGSIPIDTDRAAARLLPWIARVVGDSRAEAWNRAISRSAQEARAALGDGVVPIDSASASSFPALAGEVILVRAGHRGMVTKRSPDAILRGIGLDLDIAPAIPIIVDRLGRE